MKNSFSSPVRDTINGAVGHGNTSETWKNLTPINFLPSVPITLIER